MESQTTDFESDDELLDQPLLSSSQPPKSPGLAARLFRSFWNSCSCCAMASCVSLTIALVAVKALSQRFSIFQIAFVHAAISLPVFTPIGYFQTGWIIGPTKTLGVVILRGCFASLAFIFASASTQLLDLSEASLFNNSYPAVLVFMLWILRMESMDCISWSGIFGTLISEVLIAHPPFLFGQGEDWTYKKSLGILCSFLGVISMSIGLIIVNKMSKAIPSIVITTFAALLLMLMSFPFLIVSFPQPMKWHLSLTDIILYGLTVFSQLNQLLLVRSFQIGPPVKATMISLTRVVMMVASGPIFFSEKIGILHGIGAAAMLMSIALVVWNRNRHENKADDRSTDDDASSP